MKRYSNNIHSLQNVSFSKFDSEGEEIVHNDTLKGEDIRLSSMSNGLMAIHGLEDENGNKILLTLKWSEK